MIAEPSRIYLQMVNDRGHWRFTANELPEWNDAQILTVDITDVVPQPGVGWLLRNGVFFPDPGPAPSEYHVLDDATQTWKLRTPQEIDDRKTANANGGLNRAEIATIFETLYQVISDVRDLKGQPPITRAQLRDQMITFYKSRL